MRHATLVIVGIVLGATSLPGCDETAPSSPVDVPGASSPIELAARRLDPDLCALERPGFTLASENDFVPLGVGSYWVLKGEEDGAVIKLKITVLKKTERVGGVTTRVIEEREWEDGDLIEASRNFFAVASDETVCYFGEDVDIYEDGKIVSHAGAWRADAPGHRPGIFMPANPRPGMEFQMEGAPGIAEDEGRIVRTRRFVVVPAGSFSETIGIQESNPLAGGEGDLKIFAEDVGLIVDGPLSLVKYHVVDDED